MFDALLQGRTVALPPEGQIIHHPVAVWSVGVFDLANFLIRLQAAALLVALANGAVGFLAFLVLYVLGVAVNS